MLLLLVSQVERFYTARSCTGEAPHNVFKKLGRSGPIPYSS
jgi:hypothetical protein